MDGDEVIGHTFSTTGEYLHDKITVVLRKGREVAKGDLIYVLHPKKRRPVVYQVVRVYPHRRVREYEEFLLKEGRIVPDWEDSTIHAEAYQWGWLDDLGRLRALRYPLPPNTPVYKAGREVVARFTKPEGEWRILLGTDLSCGLEVELDLHHLIRQSCLICGSVGTGKTTTAITMVCRAASLEPPVRFFIVDKDGEYGSLLERFGPGEAVRVPWIRFFKPSDIGYEDFLAEFGWQRNWWTSKVLRKALRMLRSSGELLTKRNLIRVLQFVEGEDLGFRKKGEELEDYKRQVANAVAYSRLIPDDDVEALDPVELLRRHRIVIMDLSQGRDTWSQKHVVIAQVLKRIFTEALEDQGFGCVILLEEAMYYAPQRGLFEVGSAESRVRLLSVVKEIATNGGRNGVGLWIVTQRLATVEKTVVTQCANNIVCHALEDLDKRRLGEIVGENFVDLLGELPPGETIVKGTALKCRFPLWVKVIPELYPSSATTTPLKRFMEMAQAMDREEQKPLTIT
ncbi:ATP-binding protein [Candidatus Bathyarchaeota archaeon]|nr:ATP-binding protein [Candidatus Bathyarchaeota archaeon]